MENLDLVLTAEKMLKRSYAPYSHFHVGAALLTQSGKVFTGCNVENAAYGPSNCAERTAVFKAVSDGETKFSKIAIVGGPDGKIDGYCPPCGVCRQVLSEFGPADLEIILSDKNHNLKVFTLKELLPESFSLEK